MADLTLDDRSHVLEHDVAGGVPESVVDVFEVIDVEHDQSTAGLPVCSARATSLPKTLVEMPFVEQLRQRVDRCQAQDVLHVLELEAVLEVFEDGLAGAQQDPRPSARRARYECR